jgi:hypothetical protein
MCARDVAEKKIVMYTNKCIYSSSLIMRNPEEEKEKKKKTYSLEQILDLLYLFFC